MLVPLQYFLALKHHFQLTMMPVVKQYMDSKCLITRINNVVIIKTISTRMFIQSEINVEMNIVTSIYQLEAILHNFHHIKGHQIGTMIW